jgi:acyl-CoA reductase-like NAD-dependent aldehyde dehydrogenase
MYDRSTHSIDGRLRTAHGAERISVVNPATEEIIGSVTDGDDFDIDAAVTAAADAGPAWAAEEPAVRADHLRALADAFEARTDEISNLVSIQNGKPIGLAKAMQTMVPANYRYFASLADQLEREERRPTMTGDALILREPVGVGGAIVPWNGPQPLTASKIGPALAAGCTTVIKPAAETSLDGFILAELFREVGLPDGVANIVTGGRDTGAALVRHPKVRKIAFTGSTRAGKPSRPSALSI